MHFSYYYFLRLQLIFLPFPRGYCRVSLSLQNIKQAYSESMSSGSVPAARDSTREISFLLDPPTGEELVQLNTELWWASFEGLPENVGKALAAGACTDFVLDHGFTAMQIASARGHADCLRLLTAEQMAAKHAVVRSALISRLSMAARASFRIRLWC